MNNQNIRSAMLYGEDYDQHLQKKTVCIFGVGGVGGFVCEGLARIGVGHLILVDHDEVSLSNLNRQIIATHDTIGKAKVEVMKERILSINPQIKVDIYKEFYLKDKALEAIYEKADYVVDAIDTVSAKLALIMTCQEKGIPIISSMGTGNKTDPQYLTVCDIYETSIDPLARVMRRELKKRGVTHCQVVYSDEPPITPLIKEVSENGKVTPGSSPFVPSSAGLLIASVVTKELLNSF
ncbi:MAG: ThiF family adenylyltransferase [Beduini sp.]|uniref:tRNA threonylcarbamoyladenosine dehydratase n=1 Tax=Beduini sp. TaxID=1922300 RepID=UPI0039A0C4D7